MSNYFTYNNIPKAGQPAGSIMCYAGSMSSSTSLAGWLLCDGAAYSKTAYGNLFSIIGTTYGTGYGSTYFNVPNLKNMFVCGGSSGTDYGTTGGRSSYTILANNFPAHTHTGNTANNDRDHYHSFPNKAQHNGNPNAPGNQVFGNWSAGEYAPINTSDRSSDHSHNYTTASVGGGIAIEIIPPYVTMNYVIKY